MIILYERCKINYKYDKAIEHFKKRFNDRIAQLNIKFNDFCNEIEVYFNNSSYREYQGNGQDGPRYKVQIISYKWHDLSIIVIVEKVKECTIIPITILDRALRRR